MEKWGRWLTKTDADGNPRSFEHDSGGYLTQQTFWTWDAVDRQNYLPPTSLNIQGEVRLEFEAVNVNRVLGHMEVANDRGVNILNPSLTVQPIKFTNTDRKLCKIEAKTVSANILLKALGKSSSSGAS